MATRPTTSAAARQPLQSRRKSATVHNLADARRAALLRRLWAEHDHEGRAL